MNKLTPQQDQRFENKLGTIFVTNHQKELAKQHLADELKQAEDPMEDIPFFAIGNEELTQKKLAGTHATCPKCGKKHKIKYGTGKDGKESATLGFVDCKGKSYLVVINGKEL